LNGLLRYSQYHNGYMRVLTINVDPLLVLDINGGFMYVLTDVAFV